MDIRQMRIYISQHPRYKNSASWKARCQTMPDRQVVAIYNNFIKQDFRKIEKEIKQINKSNEQYHQIDIFE